MLNMNIEKEELENLKKIRDETGFPVSRLLEIKKSGYKIVKFEEIIEE